MKKILLMLAAAVLLPLGVKAGEVHIIVSIKQQVAWLVDGDGHIMMESPVATARKGMHTPTGNFTIGEKHIDHISTIYHCHMPYYMKLAGESFGLHQFYMPYISKDGYFGRPASHGCIRMPMDRAIFFYNHVRVGTPVKIIAN